MQIFGEGAPPVARGLRAALEGARQSSVSALLLLARSTGEPPEAALRQLLGTLQPTRLLNGDKVVARYGIDLPRTRPRAAFDALINRPGELFEAAGLRMRPEVGELRDGARVVLEDRGFGAPIWFPVEVQVDRARLQVTFQTLDGHPLRGTNSFRMVPGENGGARVEQESRFQASSRASQLGAQLPALTEHQHQVWRSFQAALFARLNPRAAARALREYGVG